MWIKISRDITLCDLFIIVLLSIVCFLLYNRGLEKTITINSVDSEAYSTILENQDRQARGLEKIAKILEVDLDY